jgi:hypothetical protein
MLTRHPFIKLYRYLIQRIADLYFVNEDQKVLFDAISQINKWPYPQIDYQFALPFMGHRVSYRTPLYTPHASVSRFLNMALNTDIHIKSTVEIKKDSKTGKVASVAPVTPLKERLLGRKYAFQHELNFYRHFKTHIAHLHHLWELVILGEPILVLSPTAGECSSAVMALVSMVAPIPYKGDYRPYFTVHNSEFKNLPNKNIILGVTNPFFVKALEDWGNIVAVGKAKKKPTANKSSVLASSPSKESLMWEYRECFVTKTKSIIKGDIKGLVKLEDGDKDREGAESLNNDQIRKTFEELTESFLLPLHKCFDTLVCSMKTFIVRSEHEKVFKKERFSNYVKKNGYNENIFRGKKADVLEFYDKFIESPNFDSWMNDRILEAYYNDVLHTDISNLLKNVTEIASIDLFLRLSEELDLERNGQGFTCGNAIIISRLEFFLEQILEILPEGLQEPLRRKVEQ